MSLRDELPVNTGVSFCSVKEFENSCIAHQVANFVKSGGKIEIVPAGMGKDAIAFNKGADNKNQAEAQEKFKSKTPITKAIKKEISEAENKAKRIGKPTMRQENRAKSGRMNIHTLPNGKHVVTIKSMHKGTFEPDKMDLAISVRDTERELLGLQKAPY